MSNGIANRVIIMGKLIELWSWSYGVIEIELELEL